MKAPVLPTRVQSQGSVNRGPPPAIPPRVPGAPVRSESVQPSPTSQTRSLRRQSSAASIQPTCTPQPPPAFIIPQRQNSRGSIIRQGSTSSSLTSPKPSRKNI